MFSKLLEAVFSASGSYRLDAAVEAMRIAQRCTIGFGLSHDEMFRTLARQALLAAQVIQDAKAMKDEQVPTARKMLKRMAEEASLLEASKGLTEQISKAYDEEERERARRQGG